MKTTELHNLTEVTIAKVETYHGGKLQNIRLTFIQDSFGEDGVFYPAQSVTIYGTGIATLRALLATLPAE